MVKYIIYLFSNFWLFFSCSYLISCHVSHDLLSRHSRLIFFDLSQTNLPLAPGRITADPLGLHYKFSIGEEIDSADETIPVYRHTFSEFMNKDKLSINLKNIPQYQPDELKHVANNNQLKDLIDYELIGKLYLLQGSIPISNTALFFSEIQKSKKADESVSIIFEYVLADRTVSAYYGYCHKPPKKFKVILFKDVSSTSQDKKQFSLPSFFLGFVSASIIYILALYKMGQLNFNFR